MRHPDLQQTARAANAGIDFLRKIWVRSANLPLGVAHLIRFTSAWLPAPTGAAVSGAKARLSHFDVDELAGWLARTVTTREERMLEYGRCVWNCWLNGLFGKGRRRHE